MLDNPASAVISLNFTKTDLTQKCAGEVALMLKKMKLQYLILSSN